MKERVKVQIKFPHTGWRDYKSYSQKASALQFAKKIKQEAAFKSPVQVRVKHHRKVVWKK